MEFLPGCRVSDRFVVGVKKCTKRLNKYVELDTLKHVEETVVCHAGRSTAQLWVWRKHEKCAKRQLYPFAHTLAQSLQLVKDLRHLLGTLQAAHEDALGPLRQGRLQAGEMVDIVTALALLNGVAAAASRR